MKKKFNSYFKEAFEDNYQSYKEDKEKWVKDFLYVIVVILLFAFGTVITILLKK